MKTIILEVMRNFMNKFAFTLIELVVVIAIVSLIAIFAAPAYLSYIHRANVSKIVNKMGTFKLELIDTYSSNTSWPASMNGVTAGNTAADSFFDDAPNLCGVFLHYKSNYLY